MTPQFAATFNHPLLFLCMPTSRFFSFISRMKFIRRWGLMRNLCSENVQEHCAQVAMVAHALAIIRNRLYNGQLHIERVIAYALYHDAEEVITGDIPTPVKYLDAQSREVHARIAAQARKYVWNLLPPVLQEDYRPLFYIEKDNAECEVVKAADKICAWIKCVEETSAGNAEFSYARTAITNELELLRDQYPEVGYFLDCFGDSFTWSLDQLHLDPHP